MCLAWHRPDPGVILPSPWDFWNRRSGIRRRQNVPRRPRGFPVLTLGLLVARIALRKIRILRQTPAKGFEFKRVVSTVTHVLTCNAAAVSNKVGGNPYGIGCGWPCSVSPAEADAEKPIDHQGKWQEGEDGQEDRAAQECRKDLLLA